MRPPSRKAVTAVILAGGMGARMGYKDKARLHWRNGNLCVHLVRELRKQAAEVVIVRRRMSSLRSPSAATRVVCDLPPSVGPVSGLRAGLKHARRPWCLFVPVDSLHPPRDLVARLARGSAQGGYALSAGDHYYLHSLVPRQRKHALEGFVADGGRSAANACRVMQLQAVHLPPSPHGCWSVNTPAQWQRLHRRAR